jgi:hypothetical protein
LPEAKRDRRRRRNDSHSPGSSRGFRLDEIERVGRSIIHSKAQGSWNRLTCDISVWGGGERGSVTFRGDASKPEWGPWRPLWDQLAAMVHDEIEARLLHRILSQLMGGESVEICSLRGAGGAG